MRRVVLHVAVISIVAACGGAVVLDPAPIQTSNPPSTTSTTTTTTALEPPGTPPPPAYEGLSTADLPEEASLVARARGDAVEVYADPGDASPFLTLEPATILGTTTVVAVVEGPNDGWAKVMLPSRPNGTEGWVETDDMMLYVVNGRVVIDLSERSLTYYEHGAEIVSTPVAVGSPRNPTPTGSFFITDTVTLSNPDSPWGPHAFGLSARSETITEYNGGDGIIGIHGTNKPGSIGNAASLGCVRVPNDVIALLHEMIPVGTPVEIKA
jgi:lipoprotein-anchoring transpeptidase ErfK/SrfK